MECDKYIEVADENFVTVKQTGLFQIKMCNYRGKPFIATLYNVLFAPDLCGQLYSVVALMNLEHTCIFCKVFCTVLFSANEHNAVTLRHSAHRKHEFLVKTK